VTVFRVMNVTVFRAMTAIYNEAPQKNLQWDTKKFGTKKFYFFSQFCPIQLKWGLDAYVVK
jgi:hypothetical protein